MNQLKTAFLVVALTVLLVLVGDLWQGTGGMIVFLGIALVMNGVAYWFSDRIALSSAQAHEVTPAEAPMLFRLADRLALQYGVPRPRVYVSPDPSPNAFATGRNPSHAAICVNDGLLRILDEEELYGVLAHEFGHVRNRDILISSVVAVLAGTRIPGRPDWRRGLRRPASAGFRTAQAGASQSGHSVANRPARVCAPLH